MNIRNNANYNAEIDIDGLRTVIYPGNTFCYNTACSPNTGNKGLLEQIKSSLLSDVKQKIQEFKTHEGLAPKEMETKLKNEIEKLYDRVKKVETLMEIF